MSQNVLSSLSNPHMRPLLDAQANVKADGANLQEVQVAGEGKQKPADLSKKQELVFDILNHKGDELANKEYDTRNPLVKFFDILVKVFKGGYISGQDEQEHKYQ